MGMLTVDRIGMILARYKSGPLPKPFKILPTIPHWEDILQVTRPESWYAHTGPWRPQETC